MRQIFICIYLMMLGSFTLWGHEKQVVVITGASRGVGLATANYLAEKGFTVYGTVRGPHLHSTTTNLRFVLIDLTNRTSIESTIKSIYDAEGHIDILINNAGYAAIGPVESLSDQEIYDQIEINFLAPIRLTQTVLPYMRHQKQGHIINISSINAINSPPFGSLYGASKAALEAFSESLSVEVHPYNIAVSIVEPGPLTTHFSILMGTRKIQDNPYQSIMNTIKTSLKERAAHPELLTPSQTPESVAELLYQIIQNPNPKLRYQTSEYAKDNVSKKLLDLTGEIYLNEMLTQAN